MKSTFLLVALLMASPAGAQLCPKGQCPTPPWNAAPRWQADSLSGGGPTSYFGIYFLCPGDTKDYSLELTKTSGAGDTLKLGGYYPLGEASGDRDSSSGALLELEDTGGNSTGSSGGLIGDTVHLDLVDNKLSKGYSGITELRPASERFNIAFWIQLEDIVSGNPSDFHTIVGLDGTTGWQVHLDKTSGLRWRVTGPGFTQTTTPYVALDLDAWYFVVAKVDGPNQLISLRVRAADGSSDVTQSAVGPDKYGWELAPGSYNLFIRNTVATWFMNFRIDELGIWSDQILTLGQEDFLFGAGRARELL